MNYLRKNLDVAIIVGSVLTILAALALTITVAYAGNSVTDDPFKPWLHASFQNSASAAGPKSWTTTIAQTASISTYTNAGTYVNIASGSPVITSALYGEGNTQTLQTGDATGIRVGEAFTTLLECSQGGDPLDDGARCTEQWTSGGSTLTITKDITDPQGTSGAFRIADTGADFGWIEQSEAILGAGGTVHGTFWAKCTGGETTLYVFVTLTGVSTNNAQAGGTCSSTWKRYNITNTNAGANTLATMYIYGAANDTAAATGSIDIYSAQMTQGEPDVVSQDVGTKGVVDAQSATFATSVPVGDTGTVCGWFYTSNFTGTSTVLNWNDTRDILLEFTATNQPQFRTTKHATNNTTTTATGEITARTWDSVCWRWNRTASPATDAVEIFINGTEVTYSNDAESWDADTAYGDTFRLNPNHGEVIVSRLMYWRRAISNAKITVYHNKYSGHYTLASRELPIGDRVLASLAHAWTWAVPEAHAGEIEPDMVLIQ